MDEMMAFLKAVGVLLACAIIPGGFILAIALIGKYLRTRH
jgi:hypothetical protein